MKQKILWLTETYPPNKGGMAQSCHRIISNLRKHLVIDIFHFTKLQSNLFQTEIQENGKYIRVPIGNDIPHSLNLLWNFIEIRKHGYSHIVAYGANLSMNAAPIFSKWLSIPLLTFFRGNDFDSSIFNPQKRIVIENCITHSSAICCVDTTKQEKISKLYGNPNKVFYTPNSIDTFFWKASKTDRSIATEIKDQFTSKKIIGVFGILKEKKGLDFLIRSLKTFKNKSSIHLLIVGDLDEQTIEYFQELGISFTYQPFTNRFELIPYYLASHFVVIPSYYDGMPNVLLEALALGVPTIGSNTDGIKNVLSGIDFPLLFEIGNEMDFTTKMEHLLSLEKNSYLNLQNTCRRLIKECYTPTQETEHYLRLFESL